MVGTHFAYRCYRSPPVMFVIGSAYMFFLQHRICPSPIDARWLETLDQHHGYQRRHHAGGG